MKMSFIAELLQKEYRLTVDDNNQDNGLYTVNLDGKVYQVDAKAMPSAIVSAIIDNKSYDLDIDDQDQSKDPLDGKVSIRVRGRVVRLEILEERRKKMKDAKMSIFSHHGQITIKSPMPGKVLRFLVKEGEEIKKGQGLVVVEAMKMENELQSPKDGTVKSITTEAGSAVESGSILLHIE